MFKKTLIAATLAALSTSAMAVDVDTTIAQTYGSEALNNSLVKNDGSALTLGADGNANVVTLTLGAEYTSGDTISIKLAGAKFKKTETFTLEQTTVGTTNEILLGFLSATDNEVTFRVTSTKGTTDGLILLLDNGTFVQGATTAVANAIILDSTAPGAKGTLSATALTGTGLVIDAAGTKDSKVIATVVQQHKFTVASADAMGAKIDVAKARKEFSGVTGEEANFIVTYAATTPNQAGYTTTSAKYTLNGSFTGFEKSVAATDNDGTIVRDPAGTPEELTAAADLQSAAVTHTAGTPITQTFEFAVDGTAADRVVLNASSYTVDVLLSNGTQTTTYAGIAAGSHALNGANAQYAYVPVNYDGAVTTQFEIGNKGLVDGEITITAFDTAGMTYSKVLTKKAEAGKLTQITDADISAAFELTKGTKLNLTFTVNAPSADVTFAGYSNRGTTGRMSINKI